MDAYDETDGNGTAEKIVNLEENDEDLMENEEEVFDRDLQINEKFNSFENLEKRIREFQDFSHTVFYKRDCVTIEKCRKQGVKRYINPKLMYYSIKYWCINGGKRFVTKTTGQRVSSTFQKGCQASFKINVAEGGNFLFISSINLTHNHQITKKLYNHLPQKRRMTPEIKNEVKQLLKLKANKNRIKNYISKKTSKVVLLKDIHNLNYDGEEKNKLEAVEKILINDYQAECYFLNEDNIFKGLFFATPSMKSAMNSYPEYVGVDATFKLLNIRAPVYLMIIEDPNGYTEIVEVGILLDESRSSIGWMMDCFKKCHPTWQKIKCIMTDKDLTEREVIRNSLLPVEVNLIMCAFHTLRTFNREITEKRNITKKERDEAKIILQKMVYAETEERYDELYEELKTSPQSIINYFNDNWHDCRREWSLSSDFMRYNFGNDTNNRLESLNAKIKQDVDRFMSLEDFVLQFLTFVECSQIERNQKAAASFHKMRVLNYETTSPEYRYANYLTNYAFRFIQYEFEKMKNLEMTYDENLNAYTENKTPTITITATSSSCDCSGYLSMLLPCRHILMVRKIEKMDLYEENLCNNRWTKKFYFETQRVFTPCSEEITVPEAIISSRKYKKKILSENEKYRKASEVTKKLAALAAEVGTESYLKRFKVLIDLMEAWQNNEEVEIIKIKNTNNKQTNSSKSTKVTHNNANECNDSNSDNGDNDDGDDADADDDDDEKILQISKLIESTAYNDSDSDNGHDDNDYEDDAHEGDSNVDNEEQPKLIEIVGCLESKAHCSSSIRREVSPKIIIHAKEKNTDESSDDDNDCISHNINRQKMTTTSHESNNILSNIIVQPALKQRGRPRGKEKTVIGLPRKMKNNEEIKVPFYKKSLKEKIQIMLKWFVEDDIVNKAMNNEKKITEDDIKIDYKKLSFAVVDEKYVDLSITNSYFTTEGWEKVMEMYDNKKLDQWECKNCKLDLNKTIDSNDETDEKKKRYKISIGCDFCLEWYHLKCAGLQRKPKSKLWICAKCNIINKK